MLLLLLLLLAYALTIRNSASCWPMAQTGSSETQQLKIPSNWTLRLARHRVQGG